MWPFNKKHRIEVRGSTGKEFPNSMLRRRATTNCTVTKPPKRGMWVWHHGKPGILLDVSNNDLARVMLVSEPLGENLLEVNALTTELRQAYFEEIPEARRPTKEVAESFGYSRKPK